MSVTKCWNSLVSVTFTAVFETFFWVHIFVHGTSYSFDPANKQSESFEELFF